jgi:hypothetical protein
MGWVVDNQYLIGGGILLVVVVLAMGSKKQQSSTAQSALAMASVNQAAQPGVVAAIADMRKTEIVAATENNKSAYEFLSTLGGQSVTENLAALNFEGTATKAAISAQVANNDINSRLITTQQRLRNDLSLGTLDLNNSYKLNDKSLDNQLTLGKKSLNVQQNIGMAQIDSQNKIAQIQADSQLNSQLIGAGTSAITGAMTMPTQMISGSVMGGGGMMGASGGGMDIAGILKSVMGAFGGSSGGSSSGDSSGGFSLASLAPLLMAFL